MGIDENKELARRLVEEFLNQRKDVIDEVFSEDFVDHQGGLGPTGDRESTRMFVRAFTDAFPDARFAIINLIAEGDLVMAHMEVSGTHSAEFMGVAATGKQVKNAAMSVVRIAGGKIVERWNVSDFAGLMRQITA